MVQCRCLFAYGIMWMFICIWYSVGGGDSSFTFALVLQCDPVTWEAVWDWPRSGAPQTWENWVESEGWLREEQSPSPPSSFSFSSSSSLQFYLSRLPHPSPGGDYSSTLYCQTHTHIQHIYGSPLISSYIFFPLKPPTVDVQCHTQTCPLCVGTKTFPSEDTHSCEVSVVDFGAAFSYLSYEL